MHFFVFVIHFIHGGIGLFCLQRSRKSNDCSGTSVSDMPIADFKRSFVCFAFEFNKIDCVFLFLRFYSGRSCFQTLLCFLVFCIIFLSFVRSIRVFYSGVLFGCSVRVFCLNQSMAQCYRCALHMRNRKRRNVYRWQSSMIYSKIHFARGRWRKYN